MTEAAAKIAAEVVALSKADASEAVVIASKSALTRFANNTIHQNVAEENLCVIVRAVIGKRVGIATGNDASKPGLRRLARTAVDIARHQQELPDFPGLPGPKAVAQVDAFRQQTADLSPARRASMAAAIFKPAAAKGATASGTVSNEATELAVANSLGVNATSRRTEFETSAVIEKGSGSGYAAATSFDHTRVDARRVGKTALAKCLGSDEPEAIEAGDYAVILEPQAVAGLLAYVAYMGFGAQSFIEGRSFMTSRAGQKVMHESVSIWDDGLDAAGMPAPFDFEGQPKERVALIDGGVARGVVWDTYYAAKAGAASTGHAMPAGFAVGPLPTNLFMASGESSLEEMIASTERGLLVTRFHYINVADPTRAVLTGLTRDGTFLVEKGRVARPVRNLRFTESMLSAFSAVEAISRERGLEPEMLGAALVPAVKICKFRFTGTTQF